MLLPLQWWCLTFTQHLSQNQTGRSSAHHESWVPNWMWVCHGKFSYTNTILNIQWAKLIKLKCVMNLTCFWWSLPALLITTSLRCTFRADRMSSSWLDLPLWLTVPRNTPSNNAARSQATVCPAAVFSLHLWNFCSEKHKGSIMKKT